MEFVMRRSVVVLLPTALLALALAGACQGEPKSSSQDESESDADSEDSDDEDSSQSSDPSSDETTHDSASESDDEDSETSEASDDSQTSSTDDDSTDTQDSQESDESSSDSESDEDEDTYPWIEDPLEHVDLMIGTRNKGNTSPGATLPFGMINFGPENTKGDSSQVAAPGGYQYDATRIRGFSLTRLSATGCRGASGDIPMFPLTGEVDLSPESDSGDDTYASDFSHDQEEATPGYYRVKLNNQVDVELSATLRTGMARFTYPDGKPARLLVRTARSEVGSGAAQTSIDLATNTVSGSVSSGNFCGYLDEVNRQSYYTLYFVLQFDEPIVETGAWINGNVMADATESEGGTGYGSGGAPPAGKGSGVWLGFAEKSGLQVQVRAGISYVSLENARANLLAEQGSNPTLEDMRQSAAQAWRDQLKQIRIVGDGTEDTSVFYTALYHSLLHPNVTSDVDGRYRGMDQAIHTKKESQGAQYANFSGWDVYRSQIQLIALLSTKRASDIGQSLLNQADESKGVWDRWTHNSGGTSVMNGDPSASTIASFVAFGADDFEVERAFDSLIASATQPTAADASNQGCPISCRGQRMGLKQWLELHYVPSDVASWGAAAETLELVSADFALAQLAKRLGRTKEHDDFLKRAQYWKNIFNPNAGSGGYIQGKSSSGQWDGGFSPDTSSEFVEGSAAQYVWMIPFNLGGLVEAMGGDANVEKRLDAFFKSGSNWALTKAGATHADLSNEPSIGSPWVYHFVGRPDKTQETVRAAMNLLWLKKPEGIAGNDDLGEMSSWYVWSALGFYPLYPGRAELTVASPRFTRAKIRREDGIKIEIIGKHADKNTCFIEALKIDGQLTNRSWLDEDFISQNRTIEFELAKQPNSMWGTSPDDRPPSFGAP
jgi:predicted alpha-1,2-mannosidase